MKKRLLCLILVVIMVLPVVLTSCGDELTPEEIANANFQAADKALTLSLWLPTDAVIDERFNERLLAVENAINDILRSGNYSTKLDIVAVSEEEYVEKLTAQFASIKEEENKSGKASVTASKYVNHAVLNQQTGIYEMAYPDVLPTQLDIFFIGGYDNLINYVNNGDVYALDEFFVEGQSYNGLFKRIRTIFMDAMKIGKSYYAVPNNHDYQSKGQYVLVNKDLFDTYSNISWDSVENFDSLTDYIMSIGDQGVSGVVSLVGTTESIPGVIYVDEENMIGGVASIVDGKTVYEPKLITDLTEYKSYISAYKALEEKNLASSKLSDGQIAAVQIVNDLPKNVDSLKDEYYVLETIPPYADLETVYSSMFAISTHSADFERSMDILYLLQDNAEIRTLLQYGIEGEDYDLKINEDGEIVLVTKNSGYKMNINYTGNSYRTYPDNEQPMSYWEEIKASNLETELHPYLYLYRMLQTGNMSDTDAESLAEYLSSLTTVNKDIKSKLDGLTSAEFDIVFDAVSESKNSIALNAKIKSALKKYDAAIEAYTSALDVYNNEPTEENLAVLNEKETDVNTTSAAYEKLIDISELIAKYPELFENLNNKDRANLRKLYNTLYQSAK